jgi:hypothetical protein
VVDVGAHAHVRSFDPGQLPPLTLRSASWHPLPAGPPVAAASTSCRCSPLTASTTIAGRPSAACSHPPANSSDSILLSANLVSVKTDVHLVMKNTDFTWRVHMIRYVIYHYAKCRADNRQILNIAHKQSPGWPHTVVPRLILQRRERRVHQRFAGRPASGSHEVETFEPVSIRARSPFQILKAIFRSVVSQHDKLS